jgi:hypothetical protein
MGTLHSLDAARRKRARRTELFGKAQQLRELVANYLSEYLRSCDDLVAANDALTAYNRKPWYLKFFSNHEKMLLVMNIDRATDYCEAQRRNLINARSSLGKELFKEVLSI